MAFEDHWLHYCNHWPRSTSGVDPHNIEKELFDLITFIFGGRFTKVMLSTGALINRMNGRSKTTSIKGLSHCKTEGLCLGLSEGTAARPVCASSSSWLSL